MSTQLDNTQRTSLAGFEFGPSRLQDEDDFSNAAMANPANQLAIQPVPRLHGFPKPEHHAGRITTTHDVHGGGNPRLVMLFNDSIDFADVEQERLGEHAPNQVPRVFPLVPGVTTIGDSEECDIWLPGLKELHAEVRRDANDEYCLYDLSGGDTTFDGGRPALGIQLHAGRRIDIGRWTLIYERAEFADHGSPYGGHVGGMFDGYRKFQPAPRPRGTSPEGGSEPTADDPGEYY